MPYLSASAVLIHYEEALRRYIKCMHLLTFTFIDPVKLFLTCSLITVKKLIVVSHTVCTHVKRSQKSGGGLEPAPWDRGVTNPLETRYTSTYVITPNSFALGQPLRWGVAEPQETRSCPMCVTVPNLVVDLYVKPFWVGRSPQNFWDAGTPTPWDGGVVTHRNMLLRFSPPVLPCEFQSHSRSNRTSVFHGDPPKKIDSSRFQDHWNRKDRSTIHAFVLV